MKKQLLTAAVATTIGLAGVAGATTYATTSSDSGEPMSGLVSAIASKFNLNQDEVQSVFDEQRESMEADREAKFEEELAALVEDGSLSEAQATAIKEKRAELDEAREANRASGERPSRDDMETKMNEERAELEAWAEDQGIDSEYLSLVFGGGPGGGHGPNMNNRSDDTE